MDPLLMIPGPVEISPAVRQALSVPPPSHVAPGLIAAHGDALRLMRAVWRAGDDAQPFVIPGTGTLAMEMALTNLLSPGDRALVVNTGYFGDRMTEMLRRRGVDVTELRAPIGETVGAAEVERALSAGGTQVVFATHVDTSTGVRVDPEPIARAARAHDVLSVFDGVCATAAERFEMQAWGADVYLTAAQKAIGLPPGLTLLVASARALAARERLTAPPPLSIDFDAWRPIMRAYEEGRPSYFSTPATTMVLGLRTSLAEILDDGMEACFLRHQRVGRAMRAAWASMGLQLVPTSDHVAADTLSAVRWPEGVGADALAFIKDRGVIVAGGLHPQIKPEYFRVGHMGWVTTQPEALLRTVRAVGGGIADAGASVDVEAAVEAARAQL